MSDNYDTNYNADRIKNLVLDRIHKDNKTNTVDINYDNNSSMKPSTKYIKFKIRLGNISKVNKMIAMAACFVLLFGALLTPFIPIHTTKLMDSIEVKSNLYGKVLSVTSLSKEGEEILNELEGENNDDYLTGSVAEYSDSIDKIISSIDNQNLAKIEDDSIINNSTGIDNIDSVVADTDERNDEEISGSDEEKVVTQNSEYPVYQDSNVKLKDRQLAKDLFGFDYNNIDIYIPFYSISCKVPYYDKPDTLTLWFDYSENDILPDFDNAKVYLYDLSTKEEVESSVIDYQLSNYQFVGRDELRHTGELDLDPSNLISDHAYYLRIDDALANGSKINNIVYVFSYGTDRSINVRTQDVVNSSEYTYQSINEKAAGATESVINNDGNEKNVSISTTDINISYGEDGMYEPFTISKEENQLAKELFNYDYKNALIYSPFYCVRCMQEFNGRPESLTLWFDFGSNDILPNFDNAEVLLYDLTTNEEVSSKVLDYRLAAYQYVGKEEIRHTGELDIDPSKMVNDHRYYISFNNVNANDTQIDDMHFIFAFIPDAAFHYLDY